MKSANKLPTSGTSRYAFTEGAYLSVIACMLAMAFGVAPIPKPHVPAVSTAAGFFNQLTLCLERELLRNYIN